MHRAGLRKNAVAHYRTGRPRLPRPEKNRKILKKSVDKSGLPYYTEQVDSDEPKSLERIWGYSSAGSASNRVCSPATESKVKKLNSSEIQQNQGFLATWGYSSAGSASNRVCSPATESKVKKLNSSEIQQNQGFLATWGYSSAGRALEWHSRGQRFDPAYLHQKQ